MSRFGLLPAMAAFAAMVAPLQVAAAAVTLHFAIPPQSLPTALIAFGRQANVQVLTAGGSVAAVRSRGFAGTGTPATALGRLLQGTGLAYRFVDAGTVVVTPEATARRDAASGAKADVRQLEPVVTTGEVDAGGYLVDVGSGATRVDSDLLELPAAVSEVPHDLLDSQQARTVADAVRNVAGVEFLDGADALPVFLVRSFQVGNGMIDGLPNSIASYGDYPPLIGIDRVEVLKGPQAIIGDTSVSNNFGGLINLVMKQPTATPVRKLEFTLGQYGDGQLGVDAGGPLDKQGRWTYRLVASGEYANRTRQGHHGQRNVYFAPSIGWHDDANRLVVSAERIVRREPVPDYAVLLAGSLRSMTPPGLLIGNVDDHSLFRTARLSYAFEHRFDDTWTFRSRGQYVRQDSRVQQWDLVNFSLNGDVGLMAAESYRYHDAFWTMQNDVLGRFDSGPVSHVLVAGLDYSRALSASADDVFGFPQMSGYNLYSSAPLPSVTATITPSNSASIHALGDPWITDHALFLQDQLTLGEHWNALLALRRATYELVTLDTSGTHLLTSHKSQWVPNVGLLYKLTPLLSVYASVTSGFQADAVLGKSGQPLPPSHSRQEELGAKLMLFGQRAMLTMAAYRTELNHSTNLASPRPPYYGIPGPGQTNRGIELEFNGRPLPGLDLSAAYSNATEHNDDGTLPTGTPRQRFNLWAGYRIQHGAWRGWGVAGGVLARSASRGELSDGSTYFTIPGQARVDANVSWQGAHWGIALGVRNLFDRKLLDAEFNENFVPVHCGRSVLLSGTRDF